MKPLEHWPLAERRQITGVFTDIDDTLTTDGAVPAATLQALGKLKAAGLRVIPITGRPVGWSEPFARTWPVDAIVAENGSVALIKIQIDLQAASNMREALSKLYQQPADERASNFERMQQISRRIVRDVPGARMAADSAGRETDIAVDHSEFTQLPADKIAAVVQLMQSEGMNATISSIHINGWFGVHNKLVGARWILRELFDSDLDAELGQWVYVGDSTNDQLMFEHFPHSVGVANIRRFEAELAHKPRYITPSERGNGFAEVVAAILSARA